MHPLQSYTYHFLCNENRVERIKYLLCRLTSTHRMIDNLFFLCVLLLQLLLMSQKCHKEVERAYIYNH